METTPTTPAPTVPASSVVTLDIQKYIGMLDNPELTDDQKREFIITLWNLLRSFAELGFEIHPVQLARINEIESRINGVEDSKDRDLSEEDVLCLTALSRTESEFLVSVFHGASGRDYQDE